MVLSETNDKYIQVFVIEFRVLWKSLGYYVISYKVIRHRIKLGWSILKKSYILKEKYLLS